MKIWRCTICGKEYPDYGMSGINPAYCGSGKLVSFTNHKPPHRIITNCGGQLEMIEKDSKQRWENE